MWHVHVCVCVGGGGGGGSLRLNGSDHQGHVRKTDADRRARSCGGTTCSRGNCQGCGFSLALAVRGRRASQCGFGVEHRETKSLCGWLRTSLPTSPTTCLVSVAPARPDYEINYGVFSWEGICRCGLGCAQKHLLAVRSF